MVKKEKKEVVKEEVATFEKEDILKSSEFSRVNKDFLTAFLNDGEKYSIEQAKEILAKKLKGVVK
ncbi:hypothetical protein [Jeotgalibaca porci]|uniref:hypothetical protein n=1 Tax=Jeotgalibaca porci TaxID=1868793 RepID=UPI0035A07384